MSSDGSRRSRRMERRHILRKGAPLNLVSLMDIFTILVFFLLVNSSSAPQLPNAKDLKLPDSRAQKAPAETLTLVITRTDILVQGRKVADLLTVENSNTLTIEGLETELKFIASGEPISESAGEQKGRAITIIGDENTSYEVISKILKTCQRVNYTNIAFAADQVSKVVK